MLKKLKSIWFLLNHGLEYVDFQAQRIDRLESDNHILTAHFPKAAR